VRYAEERGFQSDRRFAASWIRGMMRRGGRSRSYLQAGLVTRGIAREVVADALDEYEQEHPGCFVGALQEQAERVLRQVASSSGPPDYHTLTRRQQRTVISRLMRRGFSMNEIQRHFA
jgi:regulatory protein